MLSDRSPQVNTIERQINDAYKDKQIETVAFPFRRDYEIVFHESELFKLNINAQPETLGIVLISQVSGEMWRGEFKSIYLEEISRKTGREITYLQFIQMINSALVSHESNKEAEGKRKHLFIDLLGY